MKLEDIMYMSVVRCAGQVSAYSFDQCPNTFETEADDQEEVHPPEGWTFDGWFLCPDCSKP